MNWNKGTSNSEYMRSNEWEYKSIHWYLGNGMLGHAQKAMHKVNISSLPHNNKNKSSCKASPNPLEVLYVSSFERADQ